MQWLNWQGVLLMAVILGGTPPALAVAQDTVPAAAYQALNVALTEHHVVPRYQHLAKTTEALDETAQRSCKARDGDSWNALQEHYHRVMDAWMGVQHIQFGPVELFLRPHRFFFGPDHRGHVAEKLAEFLAGRDQAILDPDQFRHASVAI